MARVGILIVAVGIDATTPAQRCVIEIDDIHLTKGKEGNWSRVSPQGETIGKSSPGKWGYMAVTGESIDFFTEPSGSPDPRDFWLFCKAATLQVNLDGGGVHMIRGKLIPADRIYWKVISVGGPPPSNWQTMDIDTSAADDVDSSDDSGDSGDD